MVELIARAPSEGDVSAILDRFLRLMADPTRRRIFLQLMEREICNCEMVETLGLPQNLISHHLRKLAQAGLVCSRRDTDDQRWVYYSVDRDALDRVQREVASVFDPARIGERTAECGPCSRRCE